MPVFSRLLSIILRIGEVGCGAVCNSQRLSTHIYKPLTPLVSKVVAGIIGNYLHEYDNSSIGWPQARWIYTVVIAGLSILLGLIWLIPFSSGFFSWPCKHPITFIRNPIPNTHPSS